MGVMGTLPITPIMVHGKLSEIECEIDCEIDCEIECEIDCEIECEIDCEIDCEIECERREKSCSFAWISVTS
jgi:hypothetical protein